MGAQKNNYHRKKVINVVKNVLSVLTSALRELQTIYSSLKEKYFSAKWFVFLSLPNIYINTYHRIG